MSKYIEFFAAPTDAAAAAVRNTGPGGRYPLVAANDVHFDADDVLLVWRDLLAEGADRTDDLRMVADFVNDGSAVIALPQELVTALVTASPGRLREVAEAWVAPDAEIEPATAAAILTGVAGLARDTAGTGNRLYCWVAL